MSPFLLTGRFRLVSLPALALLAVLFGGADGCGGDPNLTGARLNLQSNDYASALTNVNAALATNPDNVEALVLKAEVLRQQAGSEADLAAKAALLGEMNTAAQRAYTLDPTNADVLAVRTNSWATSVTTGGQLLNNPAAPAGAAAGLFQAAAATLPDSMQGHFYLGLANLRAGNASEAIAPLRTAVEKAPNDPETHLYLGRALLLADQGTEGVSTLEAAAARFPDDAAIQTTLLNAYSATGRASDAISRYESAIASASAEDEPVLRYNYGALLLQAGRIDEAIPQFEQSIALRPDNSDAQYNLGAALQNKAAALNTQANAATDNAENRRLVAERDVLLGRSLPYLERARTLAEEGPSQSGVCNALFQVYTQLGRTDDARGVAACAGITMN